jgi:hypothetical protein
LKVKYTAALEPKEGLVDSGRLDPREAKNGLDNYNALRYKEAHGRA